MIKMTDKHHSVQFQTHVFIFFYVFCSFGYYLFLIPYRLVLIENRYQIFTNKLRKASKNDQKIFVILPVLCFIVHSCILVLGFGNLRKKCSLNQILDKPKQFFIMAEGLCLFGYILVFIHMVLSKQKIFINLMNNSLKCIANCNKCTKYYRIAVSMNILVIFSCAIHLCADTFYGYESFQNFIGTNGGKFYYGFYLKESHLPLEDSEITVTTTSVTIFFLVTKIFLRLSSHFTEYCFYLGSVSVGLSIKEFLRILGNHPKHPIQKIIECYGDMKLLVRNINSICGGFVVVVFAACIPHFARDSIAIFNSTSFWLMFDYTQYAALYLAALIHAAEASNKLKEFTEYLSTHAKNEKSITESDKIVILLEMQSANYPVGLEGYGFFTVTYTFLGNVCSISITYTIILLQLQ